MFLFIERIIYMAKKLLCVLLIIIMVATLIPPTAVFAEEIDPVPYSTDSVTLDDIVKAAANVVRENEGSYSSVNPDDNGALSIGWIQWHANRALNLLKTIVEADPVKAKEILGETLYNEIVTATSWSTRILNKDENSRISALIDTEAGRKAQDDLAAKDISSYINRAIGLGIKDPAALVYFADVENQCGSGGSKRIAAAAAVLAGSYEAITLEHMHEAALADSIAGGKHSTRRQRTYNNCLLLDWEIISTKLEVWDILSARNVREKPDTSSTLITTIAKGTKVIISEKALFGTQTRGKTTMGWITLDSASCALNETLTGGYVGAPVIFDTNGGSFGSVPRSTLSASGINCARPANSVVIYNKDFTSKVTPTNEYGTEITVGGDGIVASNPVYGTCKTAIPSEGFVISAIGTGYAAVTGSIKAGNYVRFEKETMTLSVYESYAAYLDLKKASGKITGTNVSRPADSIILYNGEYPYKAPQTNEYGTEVAVDKDGKVLNDPVYGLCKTPIPEEGYVLSGIGTGYAWLSQSVKAGDYIHLDTDTSTVTVYSDINKLIASQKTTKKDSPYGALPTPQRSGWAFKGWSADGSSTVTPEDICSSPFCITLTASWERIGDKLIFDTNGGAFAGSAMSAVSGTNVPRPANSLILYNGEYTSNKTPTNEYGAEAAVGADGIVISAPVYGTCQTEIPEGGFVLSGIGSGYEWLSKNVKVGSYVIFDSEKNTVTVYESRALYDSLNKTVVPGETVGTLPEAMREYHKFLGWYTADGVRVTEKSVMPDGGLYLIAKWEVLPGSLTLDTDGGKTDGLISSAAVAGTNITRSANALVIYKNKTSTGTNVYGSEAIVLNDGTVLTVFPYGAGNAKIPEGCYVLSGNGTMHTWLQSNVSQGNYVEIKDSKIFVWKDRASSKTSTAVSQIRFGEKYPPLPTPAKEGYIFLGWQDPAGNEVKGGDTVALYGDITLTAKWEKLIAVTFDAGSGKLLSMAKKATVTSVNATRGADALVIYAGKATTGTNIYGTEAVVDATGKVIAVYGYGKGNAAIPEDGFVLSGNGTMSTWLQNNVRAGCFIRLSGNTVTVYESESALDTVDGKLFIKSGAALPSLPAATVSGKAFVCWIDESGKEYKAGDIISADTALTAKWSATEASLIYNTNGGSFKDAKGSYTLNGKNVSRPGNSIILYNSDYSLSYANTNAYGTEVAVDKNGSVLKSPVYGACKTPIPEGGFVLSGIGTGYTWLMQNVKAGNYILLDGDKITVFESYNDYLGTVGKKISVGHKYGTLPTPEREGYLFMGWQDHSGATVTEDTVVTSCDIPVLTAIWKMPVTITFDIKGGSILCTKATVHGTNAQRGANQLILYKDKPTTGTNIYGTEAIVDASGKVIAVYGYGKGNNAIPAGCFALSGNGTASDWLTKNVSVGRYVTVNGKVLSVYKSEEAKLAAGGSFIVPDGYSFTSIPEATRYGYVFEGWKDSAGNLLTPGASYSESTVFTAAWTAKTVTVILDGNGGTLCPYATCTATGKNAIRVTNSLIIYEGKESTGTNIYGTEVIVDSNGTVTEIRPYGYGNAPIPEGGFVLSGHDAGADWLKSNIAVGDTVTLDGLNISVYREGEGTLLERTVTFGTFLGALPTPKKNGATFLGWYTSDGIRVSQNTVATQSDTKITLIAKWA